MYKQITITDFEKTNWWNENCYTKSPEHTQDIPNFDEENPYTYTTPFKQQLPF